MFPLILILGGVHAYAATFGVGPGKQFSRPCEAFGAANLGDLVEISAAGNYDGDVCTILRGGFTVRGVGDGRPHIRANGRAAAGKGIWVVAPTANNLVIEGIEFSGAAVPDKNGAGIRVDPGPNITIRDCHFHDNETGVLTGNQGVVTIEYSVFENNGASDGQSHNVYVNFADRFVFRGNYSGRSKVGHLLKSRAKETYILYNRLSQETGNGSREIDLSNGGRAYVVGNIIQQGAASENKSMLGYQQEGPSPEVPNNELFVVNNTFINQASTGEFVQVGARATTPVVIRNNVFYGPGSITSQTGAVLTNNYSGDAAFASIANLDLTLRAASPAINGGVDPGSAFGFELTPIQQYRHPACGDTRPMTGAIDIGAYEFGDPGRAAGPQRCIDALSPYRVVHRTTLVRQSLSPGILATILGDGIATETIEAAGAPLPATLAGVRVFVNQLTASLSFVSPTRADFQVPYGIDLGDGVVELRINNQAKPTVRIALVEAAPGVFAGDQNQALAQNQDSSLNGPDQGAPPESIVTVFLTGQGPLSSFVPTGEAARSLPLAEAVLPTSATIGGLPAEIKFLGMVPGLVGIAQANIVIPLGLDAGLHPLVIQIGTGESAPTLLAVSAP